MIPSLAFGGVRDLGAPLLETITDGNFDTLVFVVLFFGLGLYLVYDGARKYRTSRLIKNTPTEKVRSIALGRTELDGIAREAGTTFEKPFTTGECLYRDWKVEEYKQDHSDDDNSKEWKTHDSGRDVAPFYLEDDTGRVLVDAPEGATFEISPTNTTKITIGKHEGLPAEVQSFYENDPPEESADVAEESAADGGEETDGEGSMLGSITSAVSEAVSSEGRSPPNSRYRRRFTEEVLPVDEDVYVFGAAEPRGDATGSNAERLTIQADDSIDRFIVSDRDESGIVKYYSWRGPAEALLGLAMSAVTLYVILNDYVIV